MTTLAGALPELQRAFSQLDTFARSHGISLALADYGGVRTEADTTRILEYRDADYTAALRAGTIRPDTTLQRFRPIAPFGSSYHNYGAAFDVRITSAPAGTDAALKQLGSYAPTIGLRWGGHFSNPDTPHFELAIPLDEAKRRYQAMTGTGSAFDIGRFLPAVTAQGDDEATDDAGPLVAMLDEDAELAPGADGYVVLGVLVLGALAWAIHSHLSNR